MDMLRVAWHALRIAVWEAALTLLDKWESRLTLCSGRYGKYSAPGPLGTLGRVLCRLALLLWRRRPKKPTAVPTRPEDEDYNRPCGC